MRRFPRSVVDVSAGSSVEASESDLSAEKRERKSRWVPLPNTIDGCSSSRNRGYSSFGFSFFGFCPFGFGSLGPV